MTDEQVEDERRLRVVSLQVSKLVGASMSHSMTQHWGMYDSDEEAIGAAVMSLPKVKPGFSVDQYLVCAPFAQPQPENPDA